MKSTHLCAVASLAGACVMTLFAAPSAQAKSYKETVLYTFLGASDAANPVAGVIRDAQGNLYGTSEYGGAYSAGTVFKLSGTTETVLHSFAGADGANPSAGVIQDAQGNLYGTTQSGGANGAYGVVFEQSGTTETVLYSFCSESDCADGFTPMAGVIRDAQGNLYGTTSLGGAYGQGTVFKLDTTGQETVLYSFCIQPNCTDGANPSAGVIQDSQGNLYGTTQKGGANGEGTVFKLSGTTETVLYSFRAGNKDGAQPVAGVIRDARGNLYGTTSQGGAHGQGTVFKLSGTTETILHSFKGGNEDGAEPLAGVIRDAQGNLYGTTSQGGPSGEGTAFNLSKARAETLLYRFCSQGACADGAYPSAGLITDSKGNLYGTTYLGGDLSCGENYGCGVVFKLTP